MSAIDRRTLFRSALLVAAAVGADAVFGARAVEALPLDVDGVSRPEALVEKTRTVVVTRRPRRRRWVCWWRRGRRVCGWRWY
ncbi:MAG TPA: hypothetical protein VMU18_06085 [Rhodoblastus sp.]|nr:hypothetical protein [Rhodoblastus sp.]